MEYFFLSLTYQCFSNVQLLLSFFLSSLSETTYMDLEKEQKNTKIAPKNLRKTSFLENSFLKVFSQCLFLYFPKMLVFFSFDSFYTSIELKFCFLDTLSKNSRKNNNTRGSLIFLFLFLGGTTGELENKIVTHKKSGDMYVCLSMQKGKENTQCCGENSGRPHHITPYPRR